MPCKQGTPGAGKRSHHSPGNKIERLEDEAIIIVKFTFFFILFLIARRLTLREIDCEIEVHEKEAASVTSSQA